jgi:hypothetical protein
VAVVAVTDAGRLAGTAAVISGASLLVLVAAVGAVATVAELQGTWSWYRQMELVIATAAEPAVALAALTAVSAFVAAVRVE